MPFNPPQPYYNLKVLILTLIVCISFTNCSKPDAARQKNAAYFVKNKSENIAKVVKEEIKKANIKDREGLLTEIAKKDSLLVKRTSEKVKKEMGNFGAMSKLFTYAMANQGKVKKLENRIRMLTATRMAANMQKANYMMMMMFAKLNSMTQVNMTKELGELHDDPETESLLSAAMEERDKPVVLKDVSRKYLSGFTGDLGAFDAEVGGAVKTRRKPSRGVAPVRKHSDRGLAGSVKNYFGRVEKYVVKNAKYHIAVWPLLSALKDKDALVRIKAAGELGNIGNPRAVEPLIAALKDKNKTVRFNAAEALGKIGDSRAVLPLVYSMNTQGEHLRVVSDVLVSMNDIRAVPHLIVVLDSDKNADVRSEVVRVLGRLGDCRAIKPLIAALRDRNLDVRYSAAKALVKIGTPSTKSLIDNMKNADSSIRSRVAGELGNLKTTDALKTLIAALKDKTPSVRYNAADALGKIKQAGAVPPLIKALRDKNVDVRYKSAKSLGKLKDRRAAKALITALYDRDSGVRYNAAEALGKMRYAGAVRALVFTMKDKNTGVSYCASKSLKKIGKPAVSELLRSLRDKNQNIRYYSAEVLGEMGEPLAIKPLIAALKDKDSAVRFNAAEALKKISESDSTASLVSKINYALISEKVLDVVVKAEEKPDTSAHPAVIHVKKPLSKKGIRPLVLALGTEDLSVLQEAKDSLVNIGRPAVRLLILALKSKNSNIRSRAAEVLGEINDPRATKPLIKAAKDKDKYVRYSATKSLGEIGGYRAVNPLIAALRYSKTAAIRSEAAEGLMRIKDIRAVNPLIDALRDKDAAVRTAAANALAEMQTPISEKPLIAALMDPNIGVRHAAAEALKKQPENL